jgi:hypothetical protein
MKTQLILDWLNVIHEELARCSIPIEKYVPISTKILEVKNLVREVENDAAKPMEELAKWIVENKQSSVLEQADIPQESIVKILHHFGYSASKYTG